MPLRPRRKTRPPSARAEALEGRLMLTGLTGQYFDRVDFTDLKLTRTDSTVAFNWGTAAPDASMASDNFSVRWTGQVQPQFSEDYTFYVKSDDGARLWVDGRLIIDNWVNQSVAEKSATIPLTAGRNYDIRLDYYDATSTSQVTLSWSSKSVAKQTIPSARLFTSPSGLTATYYDNQDLTGTTVTRTDSTVDFNWGTGSPDAAIAPTTYSATWAGQIIPQYSQTYTFYVTPDAGATAKLWVDREVVFDSGSAQATPQVKLEAGKRYDIELTYAHGTGAASVKLEWSSPSQTRQVIPASRLVASKVDAIPTRTPTYTNSVNDKDLPDPGVIFDGGYYWMTHTTGGPNNGWPLSKSTDMLSWTSAGNMLTSANRPAFMDDGAFWAPEIQKVNGTYVLTGTGRSTQYGDRTVIAIATASEITGPYTVRSTPIVASSTQGTLDSTVFQDWDGRVYLIWKEQSASGTAANGSIRMHELDPANLTQFLAGSSETILLNNAGGGSWEKGIEEAPEMIHRGSYYYLFYSGSTIDTTYAVGVARATSLTGTYTRYPGNVPILQSNSTWGGPGHGAFVQDVDGTWWFYYHARHQDNPSYGRVQMLDRVVWTADGWPTFGNGGTPSTTPQAGAKVDAASGSARYTIAGDAGGVATDDVFTVVRDSADASLLDVLVNGVTKLSVPFDEIENLTLNGGGGNDTLLLDYSRGECSPGSGITFAGSTGTDVVRIVGASAADTFHLTAGRLVHDTGSVTYTGTDDVVVQHGTFTLDADLASTAFEAYGTDTTVLFSATPQHLGAVILSGAAARFATTTGMALSVASLAITGGGTLDLADDALIVDYTSTSPADAIRGLLLTGRSGGTWAGTGIVSSTAAAAPNRGIGYAEAAALGVTSWGGLAVDATAIVLKRVTTGDANFDGKVNPDDYALADRGKAKNLGTWIFGDFDYDGQVTQADYTLLDTAFNASTAPPAPEVPVVPAADDAESTSPDVIPTIPLRVNAGGDWFTDSLSRTFQSDAGFTGGAAAASSPSDVQDTTDDALFFTYHAGPSFTFSAPVPAGHYTLWLEFAEPDAAAVSGQRVFSVQAEGAAVLSDFDITAATGGTQRAIARAFDVTITDGTLDLTFLASAGDALISAISLVPTDPPADAAPYSWQSLSDDARTVLDAAHLHSLGTAFLFYSFEHRGNFPPSLAAGDDPIFAPDTYISPRADSALPRGDMTPLERAAWVATRTDYIYRGAGQRNSLPEDYVVAYDNPDRVPGAINVLYGDGHVATLSRADAAALIGFADVPPTDPPPTPPTLPPQDPRVVQSASNLRQLANDLLLYSNEQKGRYPATLGDLAPYFHLPANLFVNPRSTTAAPADFSTWPAADQAAWVNAHADYAYLGAGKSGNSFGGADPLVYEKSDGMTGGVNVLFGDGQVRFLEFPYADETLAPITAPGLRDASFSTSPTTQSLTFRFTEDVSLDPGALTLADSAGNPIAGTLTYDRATHTATVTFSHLPTGLYHAVLSSALITDSTGASPAADIPFDFAYVAAGTRLTLPADQTIKLQNLTIDPASTLDLSNSTIILDYFFASPAATIRDWLSTGRNGGTWDGPGLVTSNPTLGTHRAIAYADSATLGLSTLAGQPIDGTAIVLKYTYAGDANLDGRVNADDYALADRGAAKNLGTWVFGDFDYDGQVTQADHALLNQSFAASTAPAQVVASPDPVIAPAPANAPAVVTTTAPPPPAATANSTTTKKPALPKKTAKPPVKQKPTKPTKPAKLTKPAKPAKKQAKPVKAPKAKAQPLRYQSIFSIQLIPLPLR